MFGSFTEPFNYFLPISTKLRVWKLSKMLNNGAMASYLVFIVLRKETAFPRCRAMDRHGSRNTVSLVSWMMTWLWCICQYPGITQIAMSSGVPAVSMAMAMFLWHVCRCQLGILGSLVLLLLSSSLSEYIYIFLFVCEVFEYLSERRRMYIDPASTCWRPTEWRVAVRTMESDTKCSVRNRELCLTTNMLLCVISKTSPLF